MNTVLKTGDDVPESGSRFFRQPPNDVVGGIHNGNSRVARQSSASGNIDTNVVSDYLILTRNPGVVRAVDQDAVLTLLDDIPGSRRRSTDRVERRSVGNQHAGAVGLLADAIPLDQIGNGPRSRDSNTIPAANDEIAFPRMFPADDIAGDVVDQHRAPRDSFPLKPADTGPQMISRNPGVTCAQFDGVRFLEESKSMNRQTSDRDRSPGDPQAVEFVAGRSGQLNSQHFI